MKFPRSFYLPNVPYQTSHCKTGNAVAYTWATEGIPKAVVFFDRSDKPAGPYRFSNEQNRRKWVAGQFAIATAIADRKRAAAVEKAEKRAAGHGLTVGDIMRSSWGYDQTNIDYYQITALIGSQTVEYRKIARQSIETESMQGKCVPAPDDFVSETMRARVSLYGNRDSIKVSSCATAHKIEPTIVAGVKVYPVSHWTAYA